MTVSELKNIALSKTFQSAVIKPEEIEYSQMVRDMCAANACGMYGTNWICPPGVGAVEEHKSKCLKYARAFVFTTKHTIEDSFDFEGMQAAGAAHGVIFKEILSDFKNSYGAVSAYGAGGCKRCAECAYPNAPCRLPEEALPSVEAAGINVLNLAKTAGVNYMNGANTVTYFGLIFFDA